MFHACLSRIVSSNLTPSASLVERAWEVDRITVLRNNAAEIHCCSALFAEVSIARKVHRPEGVTGGGLRRPRAHRLPIMISLRRNF